MRLVMNKAKRETVADFINGSGLLGVLATIGIFIYLPISKIIQSGRIGSIGELLPLKTALLAPLPVLTLSVLLLLIAAKLKKDGTWLANTYDKLGPGILLMILLFIVWFVLPIVGYSVEAILTR